MAEMAIIDDILLDVRQNVILYNQPIITKTTILNHEKLMDKYNFLSDTLSEYILYKLFGSEYYFNYVKPFFIDASFVLPETLPQFNMLKPIFFNKKLAHIKKSDSHNNIYWSGFTIDWNEMELIPLKCKGLQMDILMRYGSSKPMGYKGKWNGLEHLRKNNINPVIDQLNTFFSNYGLYIEHSDYGPYGSDYIYWYLSKF